MKKTITLCDLCGEDRPCAQFAGRHATVDVCEPCKGNASAGFLMEVAERLGREAEGREKTATADIMKRMREASERERREQETGRWPRHPWERGLGNPALGDRTS